MKIFLMFNEVGSTFLHWVKNVNKREYEETCKSFMSIIIFPSTIYDFLISRFIDDKFCWGVRDWKKTKREEKQIDRMIAKWKISMS